MSAYHRLISYIYAYEGGVKGKNTGFAKLETRGTSCRIQVSVRRIFVGGSPIGIYLLAGQEEIRIGTLFVRGGNGEFRTVVNSENVEGSGCSMEECCGLTLHETDSTWRAYTTIWEDAVAHAAEVELADVTAEKTREQEAEKEEAAQKLAKRAQEAEKEETAQKLAERVLEAESQKVSELAQEEEKTEEIETEKRVLEERTPGNVETEENVSVEAEGTPSEKEKSDEASEDVRSEETGKIVHINESEAGAPQSERKENSNLEIFEDMEMKEEIPELSESSEDSLKEPPKESSEESPKQSPKESSTEPPKEDPAESLWNRLRATYPKVTAFECADGCEILVIKPQDIGLLPRENWVYGNNSFLLHGYYNYRYLILARLGKSGERGRYILGVPGHYGNNEKYMAAMFGFDRFVRSTRQPPRDSRFGYWYTDLNFT